jgi:hypothetical protein
LLIRPKRRGTFLGSGTTLVAAELTQRVRLRIELDPKHVDVVVQRWQQLAGGKATLECDGRAFEQIKAERVPVAALWSLENMGNISK